MMKRDRKAEEKIVDVLLENVGQKLYMSQIAKNAGTAVTTTHQVLERGVREDFIQREKLGNLSLYSLSPQDALVKQMKIKRTIEILRPIIEKLKEFSQKIILFGSAACGEDRKESDLDLFVLSDDKQEAERIVSGANIGRKIQLVVKNFLEWTQVKKKDKFFYEEVRKGIVFWEEKDERI